MTEFQPTSISHYEKIKEHTRTFYNNKIHTNPDFYQQEKIRIREYNKLRYKNDPVFAEKLKQKAKTYYQKIKEHKTVVPCV